MIFGKPGIVAKSSRFFNGKVAYSPGVGQFLEFPAQLPHNRLPNAAQAEDPPELH